MCLGHARQDTKKKKGADAPRGKKKADPLGPRDTDYICVYNLCVAHIDMRVQHLHAHIGRYIKKKKAAGPRHTSGIRKKSGQGLPKKKLPQTGRRRNLDGGSSQAYRQCKHGCLGHVAGKPNKKEPMRREKKADPRPQSYRLHMCI